MFALVFRVIRRFDVDVRRQYVSFFAHYRYKQTLRLNRSREKLFNKCLVKGTVHVLIPMILLCLS